MRDTVGINSQFVLYVMKINFLVYKVLLVIHFVSIPWSPNYLMVPEDSSGEKNRQYL